MSECYCGTMMDDRECDHCLVATLKAERDERHQLTLIQAVKIVRLKARVAERDKELAEAREEIEIRINEVDDTVTVADELDGAVQALQSRLTSAEKLVKLSRWLINEHHNVASGSPLRFGERCEVCQTDVRKEYDKALAAFRGKGGER